MSDKPICDFCSDPKPVEMYDAKDMSMLEGVLVSEGGWAACKECKDLIDTDKWDELETRCVDIFAKLDQSQFRSIIIHAVRSLHQKFREARKVT